MKTSDLETILKNANELQHNQIMTQIHEVSLPKYLQQLLTEKQLDKAKVITESQLPRTYAYQIFQGYKQAGRDKILQLAFAMRLSLEETNRLLTIAGHAHLYAKKKRDAILIFALSKHNSLMEANELLEELDQELLGNFQ